MSFRLANLDSRAVLVDATGYAYDLETISDGRLGPDLMAAIADIDALHDLSRVSMFESIGQKPGSTPKIQPSARRDWQTLAVTCYSPGHGLYLAVECCILAFSIMEECRSNIMKDNVIYPVLIQKF